MEKKMVNTTILGISLHKRTESSKKFQEILSKHGCIIKTRVGIHNVANNICSPDGVILLDVIGSDSDIKALEDNIKTLEGAEIQKMSFTF